MNKKLMAVAVAGAMFAPAVAMAQAANVTIYGIMDVDLEAVSASGSAAGNSFASRQRVSQNSSRLGFRGEEPLGNGMSAWFQIESTVPADGNPTAPTGLLGTRNTAVGLKGGFGTIFYGQWDTPLKSSTVGLDPFGDVGIAAYCGVLCGPGFNLGASQNAASNVSTGQPFDVRLANSVQYWTPNFGGFSGRLAYGANESKSNSTAAIQLNPQVFAASVSWASGPFYVTGAYEKHTDTGSLGAGKGSDHDGRIAASYVWGPATISGIFDSQDFHNDTTGASYHRNAYAALFAYVIGPNTLRAYYVKAKDATGGGTATVATGSNTGASQFALGWGYALSKRTELYVLYTAINNSTNAAYDFGSNAIGVKAGGAAFVGADPKGGALGIKHVF